MYRRWSGGRAFRRPSEQGERAGCGVGEGAPGRTKLACLSEERSRPERAAWIHQTGMPGPVSVACGRRAHRGVGPRRCDVARGGARETSGGRVGVALQAIPLFRGDLGLGRRQNEKKPFR